MGRTENCPLDNPLAIPQHDENHVALNGTESFETLAVILKE